jgi:dephospho-CoA kinase
MEKQKLIIIRGNSGSGKSVVAERLRKLLGGKVAIVGLDTLRRTILMETDSLENIVYDGYGKDYDFAAGSLIAKEAGGVVRNFNSSSYDYQNLSFIASNKLVCDELVNSDNSMEKLMR